MKEFKLRLWIYKIYVYFFGVPKNYKITKHCLFLKKGKRIYYVTFEKIESKFKKSNKIWRQDLNLWETKKRFGFLYTIRKGATLERKYTLIRL